VLLLTCWSLAASGAAAAAPQQPSARPRATLEIERQQQIVDVALSCPGVVEAEGRILGIGPGYRAWFDAEGVEFGMGGGGAPLLTWRLQSIARDRDVGALIAPATPVIDGTSVVYRRGTFTERYDIREDGLAQSFLFDQLPAGTGDLVVRLAIDTSLVPSDSPQPTDQVLFYDAGIGGVSIAGVTGIDARGRGRPGSMRLDGEQLELRLPGALVDQATLPLLLDPLIGMPFRAGLGGGILVGTMDVAYDRSNDLFLVAWAEDPAVGSGVVLGRFVTSSGDLVGSLLCLECASGVSGLIRSVVNVNDSDTFVAWIDDYFPVTVSAASGAVRVESTIPIPSSRNGFLSGAANGSDVLLLGKDFGTEVITAEQLHLEPDGSLTQGPIQQLAVGNPPPGRSAYWIAKSDGARGRTLAVWEIAGDIYGAVVDRDLDILDQGPILVSPEFKSNVKVDGDGRQWMVVYLTPNGTKGVPVFWDEAAGMAWVGNEAFIDPAFSPEDIAWMGESFLIPLNLGCCAPHGRVISVDPFTCQPCEGTFPVSGLFRRIASQRSGDPTSGDVAFILNTSNLVQRFRADDGITTDLGGGCASGGWSAATCARVGNQGFTLRLRDAQQGVPAFLAIGTQPLAYTCGSCTLMLNPLLIVGTGPTDNHGNAEVPLPLANLPSLVGATFLFQWLTIAGTACPLGLEFSNALSVQLQ
jgi:hypothetical protein